MKKIIDISEEILQERKIQRYEYNNDLPRIRRKNKRYN